MKTTRLVMPVAPATRAIEQEFPAAFVSRLAEHESWRKEVYRPIYYLHKWWARRLGSVFRAIIISSCAGGGESVEDLFWERVEFPQAVVFDPFMGSGTTIGEAFKLGCRVIGRDINPVPLAMVSAALAAYSRHDVLSTFERIAATAGERIRHLYTCRLPDGRATDVLYYFWVKVVECPGCGSAVDLFDTRVFARHAMPGKNSAAWAVCPECGSINDTHHNSTTTGCLSCGLRYDPQRGNVVRSKVTCPNCTAHAPVIDIVRQTGQAPKQRLYAKMVLLDDGQKPFLPSDEADITAYMAAEALLPDLWQYVPQERIEPGYNTRQVLNYNYNYWHQMFNARQLASLAILAAEVARIEEPQLRLLFACLFSSTLEFNNMFASFKGLGTGAVRHMFSHHILKPELMPLEANVWGTPKSSGSFSTLFRSKVLSALDYKDYPFELRLGSNAKTKGSAEKVFGLSKPLNSEVAFDYEAFTNGNRVYLSCGDSANTNIEAGSVDLIVTDPPFFDNVHYSELADFFYVWLRSMLPDLNFMNAATTRSPEEVQSTDAGEFTDRLTAVFTEGHRVLKHEGLLVFTYHHSRIEGWVALYRAIRCAGFRVVRTHPVKSEMAVAVPIQQANIPISFDLIVVCRKAVADSGSREDAVSIPACLAEAKKVLQDLRGAGLDVTAGDAMIVFMGCVLSQLSSLNHIPVEVSVLEDIESRIVELVKELA